MESCPNRLGHEYGRDGRIDTTTDGPQNVSRRTDHLLDVGNEFVRVIHHDPIGLGVGNGNAKIVQHLFPVRSRMGDFRMELNAVIVSDGIFHGDARDRVGESGPMKAVGYRLNLISVTHPQDHVILWNILE